MTLDEVKSMGRVALWDDEEEMGLLFSRENERDVVFLGPVGFLCEQVILPRTGWHHLPGCDCEYCVEED